MDRLDAMVARKGKDDKTFWTRIGVAFRTQKGDGWTLYLDALPLPDKDGRCAVSLFPPKPRSDGAPPSGDSDDAIPF